MQPIESVTEEIEDAKRVTSTPCENESSGANDDGYDSKNEAPITRAICSLLAHGPFTSADGTTVLTKFLDSSGRK